MSSRAVRTLAAILAILAGYICLWWGAPSVDEARRIAAEADEAEARARRREIEDACALLRAERLLPNAEDSGHGR